MRYSVLTLLCIITIVSAALSIMRTTPVSSLAAWLTVGWLLFLPGATLGITHSKGQRRAFWVGFAVFGWGYIIAHIAFREFLPTHTLIDHVRVSLRMGGDFRERQGFLVAGSCLWSLVFGALGGMFNSYLWALFERRARTDASSENRISS